MPNRLLRALLFVLITTLGLGSAIAQTLTVYSGRNEAFVGPVIEAFEQATGIDVEVRYGGTAALAAVILEEGNLSPADVFLAQDAGALGALSREGLFQQLPDMILSQVDARFRSPEGLWVGVTGRARVLVYSTENVAEEELPMSVFELTGPEWQGRVGWAPTNGSFQAFVTAMRVVVGEERTREWLQGMIANGVNEYRNNSSQVDAVGRGEIDLGLVNHYYLFRFLAEHGEDFPARNHFPPDADIGALINVAGAGILASSSQPEVAQELITFFLGQQSQQHFTDTVFEYPLAGGVAVNPLLPPLDELESPEIDLSDLDDLERTLELLQEVGAL